MRFLALALALGLAGAASAETAKPKFRWPILGEVHKAKDGRGVDIAAAEGEPVRAAADGEAIYASDELASFGKMIVLRHADDYVTTYAHLSEMMVSPGAKVKRGEVIGKAGHTGDVKGPVLHFELRQGSKTLAPAGFMAPR